VRSRTTGYLDKVRFRPGAEVKAGDVLLEVDIPDPARTENSPGRRRLEEPGCAYG
jgi:hypothetical protein